MPRDDYDPLALHFYRDFLDARGYRTLTATEGLLGIEMAEQEHPDVIPLDVLLCGLTGFDICRKLRADPALHALPIILITVWDQPRVVPTGQRAGATLTLRKPADAEMIVTALAQVLGQPKAPTTQERRPPDPPPGSDPEGP